MKNHSLAIGIVAGISFFLAAIAFSAAFYKAKKPQKTVSVVGLAEKDFTSDLIVWEISFSVKDMDMQKAYSVIKTQSPVVKNFLLSKGITEAEMNISAISNTPQTLYRWDDVMERSVKIFDGYKAKQTIRVESKDLEKVERVIREISDLYGQNISIVSDKPEYYYTKLAGLKIEMLAQASKDARNRAETVTQNAGSKLGSLKKANMGVFQITAPNSSEEQYTWGGTFNTSSKQKRASINMKLTYYVK